MGAGAKITEDYQRKLHAFLSEFPPVGTEVPSGTPILQYPFTSTDVDDIEKKCVTNKIFKKYTGWEHLSLLRTWLRKGTTTCNEFCTKCGTAMGLGADKAVGRFDIKDWLATRGLGHCWVPASSGALPEYGDMFRLFSSKPDANGLRQNHMGVVLYVEGGTLHSADSGQGGRRTGYDKLMRKTRPWKPAGLQGWVSIKALLNSGEPLPYWLGGWWEVFEEPYDTYYYYFAANGKVTCTSRPPKSPASAPDSNATVGTFSTKGMFHVHIKWNNSDPDEKLIMQYDPDTRKSKLATEKGSQVKLTGKRIVFKKRYG